MRRVTFMSPLLLCGWMCVSLSQTVTVQPGEDAILQCSNISRGLTHTFWSRLHYKTSSCIASMYTADTAASFCDGFQNGKYEMSSNISTIFLKIKQVDVSDSGPYLCGLFVVDHTKLFVTDLNVQGNNEYHDESDSKFLVMYHYDGMAKLISMILGAVTVFLVIIITGLAVKYRKLQTAHSDADRVNYAVLSVHSAAERSSGPASEREQETRVVYATTTSREPGNQWKSSSEWT